MPIFEYKCNECDNNFEELVFGSQVVLCPKCKSEKIEKQLSSFAASVKSSSSSMGPCGKPTSSCGSGFS